ncbi:extracellular solute-binding protein [Paenibacillus protaetiae]|uniref:Extracellular solute-binding protein n=1 Tax=Paenibacillus protaetiae TaxID=2509456 RepID=A0A4P6EUZ9_9BACL|nr:extracellular solute-binding protein [Paenibacillus protaetiae]QAY66325.1 extracellular solute-binding protein [Paenibacillus protaetiae]
MGVTPYSEDNRKVQWNAAPAGLEAFKYWIDMFDTFKIGDQNFNQGYETAFQAGKAGMIIDGSFAIETTKKSTNADWGVATIPTKEEGGLESNFGSYWVHGIAKGVTGKKLEASEKFLKFLTSEETQKYWLSAVGELPAAASFADDQSIIGDPIYGPFVKGLNAAHATYFVNEKDERQLIIDQTNEIFLNHAPVDKVFNDLVGKQQAIRDEYFKQHNN